MAGAVSKFALITALALVGPAAESRGQSRAPVSHQAVGERAVALYDQGNLPQACPLFATLSAGRPSDPAPHLYLLGCAIRRKDARAIDQEQQTLDRLARVGAPAHAVAGDWLAGAGHCRAAEREYALAPPTAAGALDFSLARCSEAAGDVEVALRRYRKAIDLNPDKEEYRLSLAIFLMTSGDTAQAGAVLVEAEKRFPRSARVLATMSLLHLQLGYADRARVGYERARRLEPDSPIVWKLLGQIEYAEGAFAESVRSYQRAASAAPNDPQTYLFMGLAQMRLEGGADEALADFLRALDLDPSLLEARVQAAAIYLDSKADYVKAARQLERAVSAAPDFARAHQLLIQAYQRLGLREKAATEARTYRQLMEVAQPPPAAKPQ